VRSCQSTAQTQRPNDKLAQRSRRDPEADRRSMALTCIKATLLRRGSLLGGSLKLIEAKAAARTFSRPEGLSVTALIRTLLYAGHEADHDSAGAQTQRRAL
jgi:hypothetical protein